MFKYCSDLLPKSRSDFSLSHLREGWEWEFVIRVFWKSLHHVAGYTALLPTYIIELLYFWLFDISFVLFVVLTYIQYWNNTKWEDIGKSSQSGDLDLHDGSSSCWFNGVSHDRWDPLMRIFFFKLHDLTNSNFTTCLMSVKKAYWHHLEHWKDWEMTLPFFLSRLYFLIYSPPFPSSSSGSPQPVSWVRGLEGDHKVKVVDDFMVTL